ncbi:hypothetical protein [Lacisediminimonas profundi]|uniref:hypothetical protein n=1 Tax=Lacisediminimonas profundi TaxID=2603856 RepID=UPI00124BBB75|nr:hypothetical protein [Lacisediminimonas profundi]
MQDENGESDVHQAMHIHLFPYRSVTYGNACRNQYCAAGIGKIAWKKILIFFLATPESEEIGKQFLQRCRGFATPDGSMGQHQGWRSANNVVAWGKPSLRVCRSRAVHEKKAALTRRSGGSGGGLATRGVDYLNFQART